jgi:carbamoyltransferase
MRLKLARGETVYLAGLVTAGHNSGVGLIEVTAAHGIRLLANDEEERFTGIKHFDGYPEQSVVQLKRRLEQLGLTPRDIHAFVAGWDYPILGPFGLRSVFEHFPFSLQLLHPAACPKVQYLPLNIRVRAAQVRLAKDLGLPGRVPLITLPHHDNHAAVGFAASPFGHSREPVMVTVLDGFGEEGAISLYVAEQGQLRALSKNYSIVDSLGGFYSIISSTQGGWTTLSSEGRYMGAVAWGDHNRLTNPVYRRLREMLHFGPEGRVQVNRTLVNWHLAGERKPYNKATRELLGDPIPPERMWNPDAVLNVEQVQHSAITRERVDLAAATQLVFEDAIFHIVDHLIRSTGSDRLVLTGGTALNGLANMQLAQRFDNAWYRRNLGRDTCLHLWVPPFPGDAGVAVGAAYNFALQAGAKPGEPMQHAFYCGLPPTRDEITQAFAAEPEIEFLPLGDTSDPQTLTKVADFVALVLSRDGVLGIYQGAAETGPRALGHRSIIANPCNPNSLENINLRVKNREPIRPLAPMMTRAAAEQYFVLAPGAADDDYNAYNYMVLTVPARPEARAKIPAVVHHDGTARIQIVRPERDPFTHAYLLALGRRLGVEVSVNTSLNVGSPIVQTPTQALAALKRAKALTGLVMISSGGDAYLSWHSIDHPPKDGGRQIRQWFEEWKAT